MTLAFLSTTGLIIGIVVVVVVLLFLLFVTSYVKAAPDTALIISGFGKRKILIGGSGFRLPFLQRIDKLSLRVFQVDIKTDEAIPTSNFINIRVDGVANLKISSNPELLDRAAESILNMTEENLIRQVQQVLQGNMREIVGTVDIKKLVQDRQGVANSVKENVVPDMAKMGIEVVNFNIQSFADDNHVIENLGIDNIAQISKDASIAKANADRDVTIAKSEAEEAANRSRVEANQKIIEQNTALSLKESALKQQTDTAKAQADAAYKIEEQKRQQEINIAQINADIAKRERMVELENREVEIQEMKLAAEINKVADSKKYAAQQEAEAELFTRQKAAEAKKYELEQEAEMQKIQAEAEKVAKAQAAEAMKIEAEAEAAAQIARANALKEAALAEAEGIEARGRAEADAIKAKAEAMKLYGEAATLQLILDSKVLPEVVDAYSKPIAEAMSKIDSITMYGEGNTAKLTEEISKNGVQLFDGLEKATGLDIKSLIAGYLGSKLISKQKEE